MSNYKKALSSVDDYCVKNDFKGYSLYDSHTGKVPFEKFGKTISFLSNQVIKRSPINFRPIIGVPKAYNPKGMGLFLHTYSLLQKCEDSGFDSKDLQQRCTFFVDWLNNNYSKGWSGKCWGYHYDWPRSDGSLFRAFTPSVVVTAFICRALMTNLEVNPEIEGIVKDIVHSATKFVLNDVYCTEHKEGLCFSYTPAQRDTVFNANLLAAEILAYDDFLQGTTNHKEVIKQVLKFTLNHQNDDGSWYYSLHPKTGKPKNQIDFHQGYMVETIHRVCETSGLWTEELKKSISIGLKFYIEKQFDKDGASLWRFPGKWPVDIHNQSQGIITFAMFKDYDDRYLPFAQKITDWTIQNMQGRNGAFYYQKWPLITNKVPYMRWNQGWMMVALATLMERSEK
jgi:hypothetical protein